PEGTQVGFLQGTGSFSQTVNLAAGSYQISFQAAQRGNWNQGGQTFEVLVDGNVVGTPFSPANSSYATLTTTSFTVTAGSHTITSQGLNPNGGDNTAFIDQVQIGGEVDLRAKAVALDQQYGFHSSGNLSQNWSGYLNEKWFQGNGGQWYYITPA